MYHYAIKRLFKICIFFSLHSPHYPTIFSPLSRARNLLNILFTFLLSRSLVAYIFNIYYIQEQHFCLSSSSLNAHNILSSLTSRTLVTQLYSKKSVRFLRKKKKKKIRVYLYVAYKKRENLRINYSKSGLGIYGCCI